MTNANDSLAKFTANYDDNLLKVNYYHHGIVEEQTVYDISYDKHGNPFFLMYLGRNGWRKVEAIYCVPINNNDNLSINNEEENNEN